MNNLKDSISKFMLNPGYEAAEKVDKLLRDHFKVENLRDFTGRDTKERDNNPTRMLEQHYAYIPKVSGDFLFILKYVNEHLGHRKSFIDVGCGIADKTLLAHCTGFFDQCYGIEYSDYTYNIAKEKVQPIIGPSSIIHGNAFDHDFSKYDTIYMYCPIRDDALMKKLLEHVYSTMKKGSIIIFFNAVIFDIVAWTTKNNMNIIYKNYGLIFQK